jgi:sulfur carrier protein
MNLTVNGEATRVDGVYTIAELLAVMNVSTENLAVEINDNVLAPAQYETTPINDGDRIELVRFVGGG